MRFLLKYLKNNFHNYAFALTGRVVAHPITQGDALGYVLVAPTGRIVNNHCGSYFLHIS